MSSSRRKSSRASTKASTKASKGTKRKADSESESEGEQQRASKRARNSVQQAQPRTQSKFPGTEACLTIAEQMAYEDALVRGMLLNGKTDAKIGEPMDEIKTALQQTHFNVVRAVEKHRSKKLLIDATAFATGVTKMLEAKDAFVQSLIYPRLFTAPGLADEKTIGQIPQVVLDALELQRMRTENKDDYHKLAARLLTDMKAKAPLATEADEHKEGAGAGAGSGSAAVKPAEAKTDPIHAPGAVAKLDADAEAEAAAIAAAVSTAAAVAAAAAEAAAVVEDGSQPPAALEAEPEAEVAPETEAEPEASE